MCYDAILRNVAKHIQLNPKETEQFCACLTTRNLNKREVLVKQGGICDAIHFVNEGVLRAYLLGADGKETTIMFAIKDWWITDMYSFINNKPSMVNVESLEQSTILSLKKADFDQLFVEIPKFERFFRILMQNAYIREQLRVMENLSLPAREKYQIFLKKYPTIANHLNQKQIASYLGITPEFLSMIKSNQKL